jgi:hypothetical protein
MIYDADPNFRDRLRAHGRYVIDTTPATLIYWEAASGLLYIDGMALFKGKIDSGYERFLTNGDRNEAGLIELAGDLGRG